MWPLLSYFRYRYVSTSLSVPLCAKWDPGDFRAEAIDRRTRPRCLARPSYLAVYVEVLEKLHLGLEHASILQKVLSPGMASSYQMRSCLMLARPAQMNVQQHRACSATVWRTKQRPCQLHDRQSAGVEPEKIDRAFNTDLAHEVAVDCTDNLPRLGMGLRSLHQVFRKNNDLPLKACSALCINGSPQALCSHSRVANETSESLRLHCEGLLH